MPPDRGKALGSAAVAVGPEVSYDEIRLRLMVGLRWKIDITAQTRLLRLSISVA
jgi:hypothetical protein